MLRSAFTHPDYIDYLLEDINSDEQVNAGALETEIFDGIRTDAAGSETVIPLYDRDIFFDAVITAAANNDGKFLDEDYITPHKSPFTNPVPIMFLKVLPRVTFSFQFRLNDGLITKDDKLKLFEAIIRDLGVGAKTNVGYGKFF